MKRVLILEDSDERIRQFKMNFLNVEMVFVEHVEDCIEQLKTKSFWGLFLDHDLNGKVYVESGGDEETGDDVAIFLRDNPEYKPEFVAVHSLNENGKNNIMSKIDCSVIPICIWTQKIDFAD